MTTRNLTSAMETAITAGKVRPVIFVEGSFAAAGSPDEEFLRLWSGNGSFDWDGKSWGGAGQLLRLSPIEETSEVKAVGFSVELSGLPQTTLALALDNTRQGRPGRVWLGLMGREGYLSLPGEAGDFASTPDSAAFTFASSIEVLVKVQLPDYTPSTSGWIVAQDTTGAAASAWRFWMNTAGNLFFGVSDGAGYADLSSTATTGVTDGDTVWFKGNFTFNDGGGNKVARFYKSSDYNPVTESGTWSQIGATVTSAGTITMNSSSAVVSIGAHASGGGPTAGKIFYTEIRDAIDGTAVAVFDPSTDAQQGSASFTSSATGETWTINQSGSTRAEIVVNENHLIADPYLIRAGRMDYASISSDGQGTTITAQYEDRLIDLERSRERRYTDEDQQFQYAGDGGFRFVSALQDKQLIWGGPGAASSALARPDTAEADNAVDYSRGARSGDD